MPEAGDVTTVVVGEKPLGDADLMALAQAAAVTGPADLTDAVRHLCPPSVQVVVADDIADLPRPLVVLRRR